MALDFSKLSVSSTADSLINPREIFNSLPSKDPKYKYLRDVQAEVLDQWHSRRDSQNLRLKMNTGAGKTLVGLLILKSCLNEGKGPAVYVAPTPYLASQVISEAKDLGLSVDDDPRAMGVRRGKSILVSYIHVLLNGLSKFGVGALGKQIPIGSLVLDDAHACLATSEQQFTLTVSSPHAVYDGLFEMFRADLESQSSVSVLDVQEQEPHKFMLVPFWAWHDRIREVETLLHTHRNDDDVKFAWPLLADHLRLCRCVIGGGRVKISPRCLPVDVVPSFAHADRRIFMSATFADDSVLVTDFAASPSDIETAIAPGSASDIGDRMIIVPQELDPEITDDEIRTLAKEKSAHHNVVVIVPSHWRVKFWQDSLDLLITADNLEAGVTQLKQGHVGLAVIVNKYDGLDLPDEACRVLILDDIPDARRAIDRIEQSYLHGTSVQVGKSVQQIEQGMGRGVRAIDDYCVVLLMGRSLTAHLFTHDGIARFTPTTSAQFKLSEQVGDQIRGQGITVIDEAIEDCLSRKPGWVKAAKSALVHVKYVTASTDTVHAVAKRSAFDAGCHNDYQAAAARLQGIVNAETNKQLKGWLMSELAEYTHPLDAVDAQQILRTARGLNNQVLRPIDGIYYQRLPQSGAQALACLQEVKRRYKRANELIVAANGIANDLAFVPESFRRFHRAICDAARLLGFGAQQPESEFGSGPDVLWSTGELRYLVIECKNEATTEIVNKKDTNQLAGSMNWFAKRYDDTCKAIPVLIHPACVFERAATPPAGTRIMTKEKLPLFRNAFLEFCKSVAQNEDFGSQKRVSELLTAHRLSPEALIDSYTVVPAPR